MALTAIILAGGLGTRLKDVVPKIPKPMAPVNGRPFLEFLMNYWMKQGVDQFILSIGYESNTIINHFGKDFNGAKIEYSIEDNPLGTGGGFIKAAQKLTKPFLLLNGDTFIEMDFSKIMNFHLKKNADWTMSVIHIKDSSRYMGLEMNENGKIVSLECKMVSLKSNHNVIKKMANGGAYYINPSVIKKLKFQVNKKISLENDLLPSLLNNNNIFGIECNGDFIDIGIPEDYFRAQEICR